MFQTTNQISVFRPQQCLVEGPQSVAPNHPVIHADVAVHSRPGQNFDVATLGAGHTLW